MSKKGNEKTASTLKRALAFIIDLLILNFFILFPFQDMIVELIPDPTNFFETARFMTTSDSSGLISTIILIVAIISILYFVLFEQKYGQTPGKMLLKLQVISDTKQLKLWHLIVRSLFLVPVFPFMLLWLIDPIVLFYTNNSQRLTEIISKTKTVEESKT